MKIKKSLIIISTIVCLCLLAFLLCALLIHKHNWGEWKTTLAATCTEDGEEARICCYNKHRGCIETRTTKALEHDLLWMVTNDICQCVRCSYIETDENLLERQRCDECKTIINSPYTPKHNGTVENGVFWELPIISVGDSVMPMSEWGFEHKDTSNGILVVDSYEQLNSLRVGTSSESLPTTHNYTSDFFDHNALIFVTVSTPTLGTKGVFFYALVTDSQSFYPVFGDHGSGGGWMMIDYRSFVIEVPRVIVDNYDAGSLKMGPGWTANWNNFEGSINWLCDKCKSNWPLASNSERIGISGAEDDSILEQKNYNFSISDDRLYWESPLNGKCDVYIQRAGMNNFEFLCEAYGNGSIDLLNFKFTEGINKIKVEGHSMTYKDGKFVRYYDYYDIERELGETKVNYQLSINLSSISSKARLTWNSESIFDVYVKKANSDEFERVINQWDEGLRASGSYGAEIDYFGFTSGKNIIKIEKYKFVNGKVVKCVAEMPITLADETKVNYEFVLGGGGSDIGGGGDFIGWKGTVQLYNTYIKCPQSKEFKYVHPDFSVGLNGGIVRFSSIADLWGEELQDGKHILRVEGWQLSGDVLSKIVSEFEFEIKTQEDTNIQFFLDGEKLRWNYEIPWNIHMLSVKLAGTKNFTLISTLAIGGLNDWNGVYLKDLGLKSGSNLIRVNVSWSISGNVITRNVGYYKIYYNA